MRSRRLAALLLLFPLITPPLAAQLRRIDPTLRRETRRLSPQAAQGIKIEAILRLREGVSKQALEAAYPRSAFRTQIGTIVTVSMDPAELEAIAKDLRVLEIDASKRLEPQLDQVRSSTRTGAGLDYVGIFNGGPLETDISSVNASGVIIGIVDSGIDYRHGDFITAAGESRIRFIWDQTTNSGAGSNPSGFAYGREWTQTQINAEIGASPPGLITQEDPDGHGSHVAGIAGGDGSSTDGDEPAGRYAGIAPTAEFIIVKSSFQTSTIIDGLSYIAAKAQSLGKRAVINLSLGGNFGPHDGTSTLDSAVGTVAASTPVIVSMGNAQQDDSHGGATIAAGQVGTFTMVPQLVGASVTSFVFGDFWHPTADSYSVNVAIAGTPGSVTQAAGTANYDTGTGVGGTALGDYTVYIDNGTGGIGSSKEVFVEVDDSDGGPIAAGSVSVRFTRVVSGGAGRVDGYLPRSGGSLRGKFTTGLDTTGTILEPATANNVIAVGAYVSKISWDALGATGNCPLSGTLGAIADFSSRGPSRDGRQKPDVSAPGQAVGSVYSVNTNPADNDCVRLEDNRHTTKNGTSMSGPVVTGLAALKLAVSPTATAAQVREHIKQSARSDSKTGAVPNNTWGDGKVGLPKATATVSGLAPIAVGANHITWSWSPYASATFYHLVDAVLSTRPALADVVLSSYTRAGLVPNHPYEIQVFANNGIGGQGPGTAIGVSTRTLAKALTVVGSPVAKTTSIKVNFVPVAAGEAGTYLLEASLSPAFDTVISSETVDLSTSNLEVGGLAAATAYHLRLASLNALRVPNYTAVPGPTTTGAAPPVAPGVAAPSNLTTGTIRVNWTLSTNPAGLAYEARMSTASDFTGTVTTKLTSDLFANFDGLTPNTSYHFRINAVEGAILSTGPISTLAADPVPAASTFTSVGASSLTFNWGASSNPFPTWYEAELSPISDFSAGVRSSFSAVAYAAFSGLTPNTTYYARVRSRNHAGTPSSFLSLPSTVTRTEPFILSPVSSFTAISSYSFTANFINALNPVGTRYRAEASFSHPFGAVAVSTEGYATVQSPTTEIPVTLSGLAANATYYFRVSAINHAAVASTATLIVGATTYPAPARAAADPDPVKSSHTLRAAWDRQGNSSGTFFRADISADAGFTAYATSVTANAFADFSDLLANTTYYLRVRTLSAVASNPDTSLQDLGAAGSTLAGFPPALPAEPFVSVTYTSITFRFNHNPDSPPAAAAEGYRVQASTHSAFMGTLFAFQTDDPLAGAGGISGLAPATTYYLRLGSLNWQGDANYISLGATRTLATARSTAAASGGAMSLTAIPSYPQLSSIRLEVPGGAFPAGTEIELNPSQELVLPPAVSNQGNISFLAPGVGFSITASSVQPRRPIEIRMAYNLPESVLTGRLALGRYDPDSGQWILLPSRVDPAQRLLIGITDHFSFFAPFVVNPATTLDEFSIFPIPWEPGGDDPRFNALTLSFTNLPANASLRIYSVTGELVWDGHARESGTWNWTGENTHGGRAGSGTYFAVLEKEGRRKVRRFVVVR